MLTASELAERAGCSEERIRQLVEAGYLAPGPDGFLAGDVQRVRLADSFEESGIPVEDIVRGIEAGMLDYSNLDVLLTEPAPITGLTYAQLAVEHDRDFSFLSRLMGALALPRPEPGRHVNADEAGGDEAAAELASRLAEIVEAAAVAHGGRPVKWLGDGVMFHFPEPLGAVRAALELVERTPALDLPPSRVGVGAGPVVYRDGDYYGRTVNVAARIADYARPGEVLVTEETRRGVTGEEVEFDGLHPVALEGVSEPVPLYRARRV